LDFKEEEEEDVVEEDDKCRLEIVEP